MVKISKIVFWGINDIILKVIQDEINLLKSEIVGFVDKRAKIFGGEQYMGLAVAPPEELVNIKFDYIFVAALSSYEDVKEDIVNLGISKEKIYPFITPQLVEYCLGNIGDSILDIIDKMYFEPEKMKRYVEEYKKMYKDYMTCSSSLEKNTESAWFKKGDLISHACGGVVNGRKIMYSNSKEALRYSINQGFKLIECDILGIGLNQVFLAHDYFRFYESREMNYSMMLIEDALLEISKYPDVNLLIDVKWEIGEEYAWYVDYIENVIQKMEMDEKEKTYLRQQIIMEVYDEETIKIAYEHNFKMFFTQYRNKRKSYYMETVNLCRKYGIEVVGFSCYGDIMNGTAVKFLDIFKKNNIKIYCFSTDNIDDYRYLKSIGIEGIFTNYIKPSLYEK